MLSFSLDAWAGVWSASVRPSPFVKHIDPAFDFYSKAVNRFGFGVIGNCELVTKS